MKEDLFGSVRVADVLNVTDEAKARLLSDTVTVTEAENKNPNDVGFVHIETQNGNRLGYLGKVGRDIFNASFEHAEKVYDPVTVVTAALQKADNPKDLIGNTKLGLRHVPLGAIYEAAVAMDDGARKYGPFNWRDHPVRADVYTDAAKRHIDAWIHGEERADDSGAHHLGHAVACLLILMDAQHHDTLKDNRDKNARRFHEILDQIQKDRDAAKKVLDDKK